MRSLLATLSLSLAVLCGCSEVNPRQMVSGMITLDGTPLDEGVIEFHSLESLSGLPATNGGAIISEGIYEIPAELGLVPGSYRVLITSGDGKTPDSPDGIPGPSGNFVSKDRIPAKFNRNSELKVQVAENADNKFDFDIP